LAPTLTAAVSVAVDGDLLTDRVRP